MRRLVEEADRSVSGSGAIAERPQRRLGLEAASAERVEPMEAFARGSHRLRRGDRLYRAGDPFEFLYVVRYGFFKTTSTLGDGRNQLTGFQLEGDILGLDGFGSGRHANDVTALEDSEVAVIPCAVGANANPPALTQAVDRALSREIVRDHGMLLMLGGMLADQRVAVFLVSLSERLRARGYSRSEFVLRMTRAEMGSFLGMRLATVSRAVTRLAREGIIAVDNKYVRIVDPERLRVRAENLEAAQHSQKRPPGANRIAMLV